MRKAADDLEFEKAAGQVILLHGWEGSADSTYILRTGNALYRRGYDIFRLNFRDHGDSHHLNRGIFYAVLLEEVFQAVRQATSLASATRCTGTPQNTVLAITMSITTQARRC